MTVPESQLSLAIGKEGQNARLAARLTGWRVDIKSDAAPKETVESAGPEHPEDMAAEGLPAEAPAEPAIAESGEGTPGTEPSPQAPQAPVSAG